MDLRLAQDSEGMVRRVQSPLETVVLGAGKVIEHYESVQAMFMEGNASGRRR
jgi:rod shape-determining protein MreB